jgi:hypothetical protein
MSADSNPATLRRCKSCGCTETRPCAIRVSVVSADHTYLVINRGCSWSRLNPNYWAIMLDLTSRRDFAYSAIWRELVWRRCVEWIQLSKRPLNISAGSAL